MRGVAQLGLERLVWDQEVAGSNPVTPSIQSLMDFAGGSLFARSRGPGGLVFAAPAAQHSSWDFVQRRFALRSVIASIGLSAKGSLVSKSIYLSATRLVFWG